jgi:RNAse (barnase) inhibitor barstar
LRKEADISVCGEGVMAEIKAVLLDGTDWRTKDDFYNAFFTAVGAPDWHGKNFNALRDSIVAGQINQINLPYTIRIEGLDEMSAAIRTLVEDFCSLIKELCSGGQQIDVSCQG